MKVAFDHVFYNNYTDEVDARDRRLSKTDEVDHVAL